MVCCIVSDDTTKQVAFNPAQTDMLTAEEKIAISRQYLTPEQRLTLPEVRLSETKAETKAEAKAEAKAAKVKPERIVLHPVWQREHRIYRYVVAAPRQLTKTRRVFVNKDSAIRYQRSLNKEYSCVRISTY